jgi:hypothetical protein
VTLVSPYFQVNFQVKDDIKMIKGKILSLFLHGAPPFHMSETPPVIPSPLSYNKTLLFPSLHPNVLFRFFFARDQEPKSCDQNHQQLQQKEGKKKWLLSHKTTWKKRKSVLLNERK